MVMKWKNLKIRRDEGEWESISQNFVGDDGREYGCWNKILRRDEHGLTLFQHFKAPPKKAFRLTAVAPDLGEEVFVLSGAYYNRSGHITAGPGTYMFNAPGARHGGIVCEAKVLTHWCSGKPDEDLALSVIDFQPLEEP